MSIPKPVALVIGGAGYIGSHMVRALLDNSPFEPVVFDNLSTGHREFVPKDVRFIKGDLRSEADIRAAFGQLRVDTVLHFAASSLVGESVQNPLKYYENNVAACVNLLKAMTESGVGKFIFSSTAAVYGEPERVPIEESDRTKPTNPYGQSKLTIENMLRDVSHSTGLRFVALRYFNACGAHNSAMIGERHDPETHLIPNILKAVAGGRELTIFGTDYDTPDGTCVRDYVHVTDLCRAHLLAADYLDRGGESDVFNLGHGSGFSVNEVIEAARRVTGSPIPLVIGVRRPGDPARLIASSAKASRILGWSPQIGLEEIVRSAWAWEQSQSQVDAGVSR